MIDRRVLVRCSCGTCYTRSEWQRLPWVGLMGDGNGGQLELRNCPCGSTRATPNVKQLSKDHYENI